MTASAIIQPARQFQCMPHDGHRGSRFARLSIALAFVLMALVQSAFGQILTETDSLGFEVDLEDTSTVTRDSLPAKVVAEKTELLDPVALMNGGNLRQLVGYKPELVMYPDMLDRVGGFAQTLGQWGMPYQRYLYGTDAANFDTGITINPITGAENAYMVDPEHGMRYYDTRTPFLNAYYSQGKADAVQMRVDLAQNVHPLVNVGALYYRRQSNGVYTNHVTDQNTIGVSSNFHTQNDRYQVFAHFLMQNHKDQINGGVKLASDGTLFNTTSQPVGLDGANLQRASKALGVQQFYRILGDSFQTTHSLYAYAGFLRDRFQNNFYDLAIPASVNSDTFIVYPNVGFKNYFNENMVLRHTKANAGLSYRYQKGALRYAQRAEFAQEWNAFIKSRDTLNFLRNTILLKGDLNLDPMTRALEVKWTYRLSHNQLFRPETYAEVEAAYRIGSPVLDYTYKYSNHSLNPTDSTTVTKEHRPLGIVLHTLSYGRNPTLQQSYGTGFFGSNFVGNDSLNNRRINHFSLGLELLGKSRWSLGGGEVEGNRLRVSVFSTRQKGLIYFDGDRSFQQQAYNRYAGWFGAEVKMRVHWKSLFAETEIVAQGFGSNSDSLTTQFSTSQPRFYSKTSIFFDKRNLKFAKSMRFGLDYWYFSSYDTPFYDPSLQAFYRHQSSTPYNQFGYPRADVWITVHVKRVHLFLKFINLLEALPQTGYFTTAGYPMQVRQLQLGLNWTFFD